MGQVIALVSRKGGTGKTTLSMNLAAAAAREPGITVGALDLDPQGSLTDYAAERKPESGIAGLTVTRGNHPVTREAIARWASEFDLAVLDCPPQLGPTSRTAARCASTVVIPIEPSPLSLYALVQTLDVLEDAPARRVVVLARAIPALAVYRWARSTLEANAEKYGYVLAPTPIVWRPALYAEMVQRGEAAVTLYPDGPAAAEVSTLLALALNRTAASGRVRSRAGRRAAGGACRRRA